MKIAFIGDIAFIGKYDITKNQNVKDKLKLLSDKLSEYDYVVGNLESPLTEKSNTLVCKSMHLKSSVMNVELLKYLNINAVSLANNHLYDYGKKGMDDTIDVLEKNNIDWFGLNNKSTIKKINGEIISLSGFACYSTNGSGYKHENKTIGINPLTYEEVTEQLEKDKANKAFSIMSFHWGDEHTNYPKYEHLELAKKIVKIKDVIIHGHHPHVIQGIQKYENSIVSYSLGNFLFDDCVSINGKFVLKQTDQNKKSFILEVELENGVVRKTSNIGFREINDAFYFFDIDEELSKISVELEQVKSEVDYEKLRSTQIKKARLEKFGKRDFEWFLSRLNYYSVGARILTKLRKRNYDKAASKFK